MEETEKQLQEINNWLAGLDADAMPPGISPAQFSYLLYRLGLAYELDMRTFADCAINAAANIKLAEARRTEH